VLGVFVLGGLGAAGYFLFQGRSIESAQATAVLDMKVAISRINSWSDGTIGVINHALNTTEELANVKNAALDRVNTLPTNISNLEKNLDDVRVVIDGMGTVGCSFPQRQRCFEIHFLSLGDNLSSGREHIVIESFLLVGVLERIRQIVEGMQTQFKGLGRSVDAFGEKVNKTTFVVTDNDDTFDGQRAIAFKWILIGLMILIGLQGINLSTEFGFTLA
jgi:hypothetical protein